MRFETGCKRVGVLLLIMMCCALFGACSNTGTNSESSTMPAAGKDMSPEPVSSVSATQPAAASPASPKPAKNGPLTIQYVGNSCFLLTFPDGTTIATDPYPAKYERYFGPAPDMEVTAYSLSHYHEDHVPGKDQLKGNPKRLVAAMMKEPVKVGDVEVTGFATKHVNNAGENEVFVFRYGDLKIVHMGETDRIESPDALEAVKGADVVLAYAGEYGPNTLKNDEIFKTLYDLNVKVLIPQHFSNNPEAIFYGGPTIDKVLKVVPQGVETVKLKELVVKKDMKKQFVELSQINAK